MIPESHQFYEDNSQSSFWVLWPEALYNRASRKVTSAQQLNISRRGGRTRHEAGDCPRGQHPEALY